VPVGAFIAREPILRQTSRFLDLAANPSIMRRHERSPAGGAEDMFLDIKDLAVRRTGHPKELRARQHRLPNCGNEASGPARSKCHAELLEGQIRVAGEIETKVELVLRSLPGAG